MTAGHAHRSSADRLFSRRTVLQRGGGLASTVVGSRARDAAAQDATPAASPAGTVLPPPGTAEILWDTWGVPHIFAGDDASLFYAFGWAEAHNPDDALLRPFGGARGRVAEYWGEAELESDVFTLTAGAPGRAARWYDIQAPAAAVAVLEQAAGKLVADAGSLDAPWGQVARLKVGTYDEPAGVARATRSASSMPWRCRSA